MKIIFVLLLTILVSNNFILAQGKPDINSKQKAANLAKPLFEDEIIQVYYKANSVMPGFMMKMKLSEGPMYYFGKLTIVNKANSELEVKVDVLNKMPKSETIAHVNELAERRLAYNENISSNASGLGAWAIAEGVGKNLKNKYNAIKSQIDKNFISDTELTELKLAVNEEKSLEFGLENYKQKPQIALSYKASSGETKFFFQDINDQELQKQILSEPKKYLNMAFLNDKMSSFKSGFYLIQTENEIKTANDLNLEKAAYIPGSQLSDSKAKALPTISSTNKFQAQNLNLIILQNYKKQPSKQELVLWKLTPNEKTQERKISHKIPFKTIEIDKGILKLSSFANKGLLLPGEYALSDNGKEIYYEFTINK